MSTNIGFCGCYAGPVITGYGVCLMLNLCLFKVTVYKRLQSTLAWHAAKANWKRRKLYSTFTLQGIAWIVYTKILGKLRYSPFRPQSAHVSLPSLFMRSSTARFVGESVNSVMVVRRPERREHPRRRVTELLSALAQGTLLKYGSQTPYRNSYVLFTHTVTMERRAV